MEFLQYNDGLIILTRPFACNKSIAVLIVFKREFGTMIGYMCLYFFFPELIAIFRGYPLQSAACIRHYKINCMFLQHFTDGVTIQISFSYSIEFIVISP